MKEQRQLVGRAGQETTARVPRHVPGGFGDSGDFVRDDQEHRVAALLAADVQRHALGAVLEEGVTVHTAAAEARVLEHRSLPVGLDIPLVNPHRPVEVVKGKQSAIHKVAVDLVTGHTVGHRVILPPLAVASEHGDVKANVAPGVRPQQRSPRFHRNHHLRRSPRNLDRGARGTREPRATTGSGLLDDKVQRGDVRRHDQIGVIGGEPRGPVGPEDRRVRRCRFAWAGGHQTNEGNPQHHGAALSLRVCAQILSPAFAKVPAGGPILAIEGSAILRPGCVAWPVRRPRGVLALTDGRDTAVGTKLHGGLAVTLGRTEPNVAPNNW